MFDINNVRELIVNGFTIEVFADDDFVSNPSNLSDKVWGAIEQHDTAELLMTNSEGNYQGGVVLTKSLCTNGFEAMYVHENSDDEVRRIVEYESPLKPLVWELDASTFGHEDIHAYSPLYTYTVSIGSLQVTAIKNERNRESAFMTNGVKFESLDEVKLWVERTHYAHVMKEYCYGI